MAQIPCHLAQYNFTGNANDSKGSNHGTVYNATLTNDRYGNANSAYLFSSSSSSYISIPYNNFFNANYSYSLWVKPTSFASYGNSTILVSIGGNGGDQNMQLENNRNYGGSMGTITGFSLTAYQKSGSTVSVGGTCVGSMPNTNQWYHIVVTRDSSFYRIYVNGCLKATSANSNGALPFYGNNNFDARIGCRERGGLYFDGVIDDVGIYNCALTAAHVTKLYNNLKPLVVSKDTTICKDQFQQFKLKAPPTYCTYRWVDMANPSSVLGTDSQLLINITSTKTFRCITNSKDTAFATVKIIPRPNLNIGPDSFYCGKVVDTLDAGPKAFSYLWDDNSSSRYRPVKDTGQFHVLYTDSFGCKARDTIRLRIHKLPVFNLGRDTHYCNTFSRTLSSVPLASKYIWNTNDSIQNITVSAKGLYWVEAIDTNDCVFKDSIIIENPLTNAGFTVQAVDSCLNTNRFVIKDTSWLRENNKVSSRFYFGDGNNELTDSTVKKYSSYGTFTIRQIIQTDSNCIDSAFRTINVWPNAKPNFSINDSLQCIKGHSFMFSNNSSIPVGTITYAWTFGDNDSDTSINIASKEYVLDSNYNVRLITISDKFCSDTTNKQVTVYPNAKIDFSIDRISQCFNGHELNIDNLSTIRTGSIDLNIWRFSDMSIDTSLHNYSKTFDYPDSLEVVLETVSNFGCRDTLIKEFVIFPNTSVDFIFSRDTQCFKWNTLNIDDNSNLSQGTYTTNWNLGDGNTSSDADIVNKTYGSHGNYDIRLITTTDNGCKDTLVKQIVIKPSPVDTFSILDDRQCFRHNTFNFTNNSTIPAGSIVNRVWDLDDGNTFGTMNVSDYVYQSEDSFYVSLSSTSDLGCKDTFIRLAVTFAQPVAQYTIPNDSQCWQKNYFNIINQTTLKYGKLFHNWDFGDYTSDTNYTPTTKKYANKSADYVVRYKVTSDNGCTDSLNHRISLLERPISEFIINDSVQCFRTHLFSFNNQTTFSAMHTVSYFWDYDNSDTSIGYLPKTATYSAPGYKNVRLIAYSYLTNCYDTVYHQVLPAPHSVPDFSFDKDSQCLRTNRFVLTNKSNVMFGTLTYVWDFGDGSKSTLKDPIKTYSNGFKRDVKLVSLTDKGCSDSISKPLILIPHPISRFTINDSAQCLNNQSFDFVNTSTTSYGTYTNKWIFDDGDNSTQRDYSNKQFAAFGYHTIKLAVFSYQNCPDTFSRIIFLEKDGNTAIAQYLLDSQCLKRNEFDFEYIKSNPDVDFVNYNWDFGDAQTSTASRIKHRFSTYGKKNIRLETISDNSCRDTAFYEVVVHPQANPDFTATSPCDPDSVEFSNLSNIVSGSIQKFIWDFGDGSNSILKNPSHKYSTFGNYTVSLFTESDFSCKDTIVKTSYVRVREKPTAAFDFERLPDKQFDVATLKFSNMSSSDVVLNNWNFGNGNFSTEVEPEADFTDTFRKLITLIVTNDEGCTDTFSKMSGSLVSDFVFYMPSAFSPGSNGINDVLKPIMTPYVKKYQFEIFNRWGERVFYSDDVYKGWDGKYQGEDCEQGVYLCRIYLVPMRGAIRSQELSITLLR